MARLTVSGIEVYAYHGCLGQESSIGEWFVTDVMFETEIAEAAQTDNLTKAIDYVKVKEVVEEQMAIRANLIETVAQRIWNTLSAEFKQASYICVSVTKKHPPINQNVAQVCITVDR